MKTRPPKKTLQGGLGNPGRIKCSDPLGRQDCCEVRPLKRTWLNRPVHICSRSVPSERTGQTRIPVAD